MNNSREKFEAFDSSYYRFLDTKPTYEKLAVFEKQDPYTIVYADHDVQVRFLNFTAAWLAATEQSQKEIAGLEAKLNELVKFQSSADRLAKAQTESLNTIAELKAREKELVEAISSSLNCIREEINLNNYTETALGDFISGYGDMVIILEQALATVRGE